MVGKKNIFVSVVLVLSILMNLYIFGWRRIEQHMAQKAIQATINTIVGQVQQNGQVVINTPQGTIVLVPEEEIIE